MSKPINTAVASVHKREASTAGSERSRCESPLLPMGQHPSKQVDPDRLSQQLERTGNRQSQQSMLYKSYAIPEDADDLPEPADAPSEGPATGSNRTRYHIRRPHRQPRAKSYRTPLSSRHESARELSSKFKSACRKLDPRRLAKGGHSRADASPPPDSGEESGPA
ncbi:hypothetical protein LPJ58_004388 [Coemansia sp. RSA 1591]|nr:hypothetical protein LPJ58_004388 [Coemansia sp. RSA 1591]KAJ1757699.1 hypothetical protein LPJ69_004326 [Coemansia sp. RSA 1752]KAJ2709754.1 hypothetical protein H4S00_006559 [Coemansia sp. D1744]